MALNPGFLGLEVLAGAFATLIAGLGVYYKRRRDNRRKLRVALKQEIDGMKGPIKGYAGAMSDSDNIPHDNILPETNFVTTIVYENNTHNLGLLSEEEVEAVSEFYDSAIRVRRALEMLQNHEDPLKTASYQSLKEDDLDDLKIKNEKALDAIEKRL